MMRSAWTARRTSRAIAIHVLAVAVWSVAAHAQTAGADSVAVPEVAADDDFKRHKLTLAPGYTFIADGGESADGDRGVWVFGLGLDYFYRLNEI